MNNPHDDDEEESLLADIKTPAKIKQVIELEFQLNPTQRRLIETYYKDLIADLQRHHICPQCDVGFTLWDSAGLCECRMHPGYYSNYTWSCCRQTNVAELVDSDPRVKLTYQSPEFVAGCTRTDHYTPGEINAISPQQVYQARKLVSSNLSESAMRARLRRILVPKNRTTKSTIEVPLMVYWLMPDPFKRAITKINIYDPAVTEEQWQQQEYNGSTAVDHPFASVPEERPRIKISSELPFIDAFDMIVHLSRVSVSQQ